jgi:alcohol dehydrogenase (cytochrome c)
MALIRSGTMLICLWLAAAHAGENAADWPSYFGNHSAWSYSTLEQIDTNNVGRLRPAWSFSIGKSPDGLSATPLVLDGVLFLPTPQNEVFALDAATGQVIWTYREKPLQRRTGARKTLGLAAGFGFIFLAASDHRLIALDQHSGREVWSVLVSDPRQCGCGPAVAPLLVKDKVILGVSSSDTGHRGYIDAYDARTGRFVWRFWAIPGPGELGHDSWPEDLWRLGTASTWFPGSYDAKLNLIFWGIGNPGPMLGGDYPGHKLFSDSLVALDADTGRLRWYFQQIPNDKLDYDSALEPVLIDSWASGKLQRLIVHPTKSGFAYVIDAETGHFVRGFRYADVINWTPGLDSNGQPLEPRLQIPLDTDTVECPGLFGARAIGHSTYSEQTGLWYNTSYETCSVLAGVASRPPQEGVTFNAARYRETHIAPSSHPYVAAYDPVTGARKWTYPTHSVNVASLLSTAGGLVFGGDIFGELWALDAAAGRKLWSFNVGTGISGTPITFAAKGQQYLAVTAGMGWVATALVSGVLAPEEKHHLPEPGAVLTVFTLPPAIGERSR